MDSMRHALYFSESDVKIHRTRAARFNARQ